MLWNKQTTDRIWAADERARMQYKSRVQKYFIKALNDQIRPVIALFDRLNDPKEIIERAESLIKEDPIREAMMTTYKTVGVDFARRAVRGIKSGAPGWMKGITESQWRDAMTSFVEGPDMGSRITAITGESKRKAIRIMRNSMRESVDEGLGIGETSIRMRSDLREGWGRMRTYRSERIARTELVSAANKGSIEGARSTDLDLVKIWIATPDARIRSEHAQANGEARGLNESFILTGQNLDFPGDPNGSAWNVINCRCSVGYEDRQAWEREHGALGEEEPIESYRERIEREMREQEEAVSRWEDKPDEWEAVKDLAEFKAQLRTKTQIQVVEINGLDPVLFDEVGEHLLKMTKEYKASGMKEFSVYAFGKRAYARANSMMIEGNKNYFQNAEKFRQNLVHDMSAGWHPKGIPEADLIRSVLTHEYCHSIVATDYGLAIYGDIYSEARAIKGRYTRAMNKIHKQYRKDLDDAWERIRTRAAEAGESATYESEAFTMERDRLKKIMEDQMSEIFISDYASSNLKEFMAESWAMYKHSAEVSPYAREIGQLIEKTFKN